MQNEFLFMICRYFLKIVWSYVNNLLMGMYHVVIYFNEIQVFILIDRTWIEIILGWFLNMVFKNVHVGR
jgi:hypothetical protein